jgi:hypothetical protein
VDQGGGMSFNSLLVINEAAEALRDPAFGTITQPRWLSIQNRVARIMARKMRLVEWTTVTGVTLAEPEYEYPSDSFQIISVRYNETPGDPTTWFKLGELFSDEFEARTQRNYSTGTPMRYYPATTSLFLHPMPDVTLASALKVRYWGLPDAVTNASTQDVQLSDTLRDLLLEGMIAYGFDDMKDYESGASAQQKWQAALTFDRDRFEDKSADRRSRLRPRASNYGAR